MRRVGVIALWAACGFHTGPSAVPSDGGGAAGSDSTPPQIDASVTGVDARSVYGTGIVKIDLSPVPTSPLTLTGFLNTDDNGACRQLQKQPGGPELCVVAGTTVTVSGAFVATGARPLVVVGTDSITIPTGATIDVSSNINPPRRGAGANTGPCSGASAGEDDGGGGGGGGGGGFGTAGGTGGLGDTNNDNGEGGTATGGSAGAAQPEPTVLRGGCSGFRGGNGTGTLGGVPGHGGGAVYLIAGTKITVAGDIFASGGGGGVIAGAAGIRQGGGGAGSGGMIGLDAPALDISGRIAANGGGGAGGGSKDVGGFAGGDGTTTSWDQQALGGNGAGTEQGPGGKGTAIGKTGDLNGDMGVGGGAGGGGGLGLVWLYGTTGDLAGKQISPAPVLH